MYGENLAESIRQQIAEIVRDSIEQGYDAEDVANRTVAAVESLWNTALLLHITARANDLGFAAQEGYQQWIQDYYRDPQPSILDSAAELYTKQLNAPN